MTLAALPALAQAPAQEAPKNLQVLPKDWTRPQVVAVMQNFNAALGVGCDHCHVQNQGVPPGFRVPQPKQLAEILARTSADKGFAAAAAQYNELKTKYYGAQAYDFSESGLIATAQPLVPARADEAIQFLNLNLGLFPQSAQTLVARSPGRKSRSKTRPAQSRASRRRSRSSRTTPRRDASSTSCADRVLSAAVLLRWRWTVHI